MTWSDVLLAQLIDPFRIALIVGLGWTTLRLRQSSGIVMPLIAGTLFFAVMLPMTLPMSGAPSQIQMITGFIANVIILAVLASFWLLLQRFRR